MAGHTVHGAAGASITAGVDGVAVSLAHAHLDAVIDHACAEYPHECCGVLAGRDGRVEAVFRTRNVEASPVAYRLDPVEQLRVFREIDARGLDLLGIYHSHTGSAAYPSSVDVRQAYYPDAVHVIVSLADHAVVVRAFRIRQGVVTAEDLIDVG